MGQSEIILAYDFGGTKVGAALVTTERRIVKRDRIQSSGLPAVALLGQVIKMGDRLLKSVNDCTLTAVGVSMCGVVIQDRVELAPNLIGIEELNVRRILTDAFHVPIVIENDVKAATLAELRQGNLKGTDYGLYVNFGTGISAGFTAGNRVMRGHSGAAGEIGYLMKSRNDTATFKSGHASFEEFSSGSGVSRRYADQYGKTLTTKEIFEMSQPNPEMRTFISEICHEIGYQVANLAIMWNPEKIAIGGGMAASYQLLHDPIMSALVENVPYPPDLVRSNFLQDASLYGAMELAFSANTDQCIH